MKNEILQAVMTAILFLWPTFFGIPTELIIIAFKFLWCVIKWITKHRNEKKAVPLHHHPKNNSTMYAVVFDLDPNCLGECYDGKTYHGAYKLVRYFLTGIL